MAKLGEALILIKADSKGTLTHLGSVTSKIDQLGASIKRVGFAVAGLGGLIKTTFGALAIKSAKVFASISQELQEARSIAGASKKDWERVEKTVERLGIHTQFMQTDIARGVRQIVSAGYGDPKVFNPMIKHASFLAAAIGADLPSSIGLSISAMESFRNGMIGAKTSAANLERVVRDLSDAQAAARIELRELQFFMYQVPAAISQFNLSSRDALAAFGALNQVMGNGRRAAMAVRQAIEFLARLPARKEFESEILPALRAVGKTADDINPKIVGVGRAFQTAADAGLDQLAKASLYFGVSGLKAVTIVGKNHAELYHHIRRRMDQINPTMKRARDNLATLHGAWHILTSTLEAFFNSLGRAISQAGLEKLIRSLDQMLKMVVRWMNKNQKVIAEWMFRALKLGAALLGVGTSLAVVGQLIQYTARLLTPMGALWTAAFLIGSNWILKHTKQFKQLVRQLGDMAKLLSEGKIKEALVELDAQLHKHIQGYATFKRVVKETLSAMKVMWAHFSGQEVDPKMMKERESALVDSGRARRKEVEMYYKEYKKFASFAGGGRRGDLSPNLTREQAALATKAAREKHANALRDFNMMKQEALEIRKNRKNLEGAGDSPVLKAYLKVTDKLQTWSNLFKEIVRLAKEIGTHIRRWWTGEKFDTKQIKTDLESLKQVVKDLGTEMSDSFWEAWQSRLMKGPRKAAGFFKKLWGSYKTIGEEEGVFDEQADFINWILHGRTLQNARDKAGRPVTPGEARDMAYQRELARLGTPKTRDEQAMYEENARRAGQAAYVKRIMLGHGVTQAIKDRLDKWERRSELLGGLPFVEPGSVGRAASKVRRVGETLGDATKYPDEMRFHDKRIILDLTDAAKELITIPKAVENQTREGGA